MTERRIDLDRPPSPDELRLQLEDCVISIWLPASAGVLGKALTALADAGFDVPELPRDE